MQATHTYINFWHNSHETSKKKYQKICILVINNTKKNFIHIPTKINVLQSHLRNKH